MQLNARPSSAASPPTRRRASARHGSQALPEQTGTDHRPAGMLPARPAKRRAFGAAPAPRRAEFSRRLPAAPWLCQQLPCMWPSPRIPAFRARPTVAQRLEGSALPVDALLKSLSPQPICCFGVATPASAREAVRRGSAGPARFARETPSRPARCWLLLARAAAPGATTAALCGPDWARGRYSPSELVQHCRRRSKEWCRTRPAHPSI